MQLLLDTHILLWWLMDDDALVRARSDAIEQSLASEEPIALSAITFWEIAKLVELGRLRMPRSLDRVFEDLEEHPQLAVLPLCPRVCLESTRLGTNFHEDPADQIIAATARVHALRLVTADERIRSSGVVMVL